MAWGVYVTAPLSPLSDWLQVFQRGRKQPAYVASVVHCPEVAFARFVSKTLDHPSLVFIDEDLYPYGTGIENVCINVYITCGDRGQHSDGYFG